MENCRAKIVKITNPRCRICGTGLVSEVDTCLKCRNESFFFDSSRSLYNYWGEIPQMIYRLKNKKDKSIIQFFAGKLAEEISAGYEGYLLVPVPCSPRNKRRRGYDQMLLVAKLLERRYGIQTGRFLVRKKGGKAQKQLGISERKKNVRNKYICRSVKPNGPEGKKCLLLDDVFTTGATLDACAAALLSRGAKSVLCLTIARD